MLLPVLLIHLLFFFQAEDGIRDGHVTGVQTCALPISDVAIVRPPRTVATSAPRAAAQPALPGAPWATLPNNPAHAYRHQNRSRRLSAPPWYRDLLPGGESRTARRNDRQLGPTPHASIQQVIPH